MEPMVGRTAASCRCLRGMPMTRGLGAPSVRSARRSCTTRGSQVRFGQRDPPRSRRGHVV